MSEFKVGDKVVFSHDFRKRYYEQKNDAKWIDEMPKLMCEPHLTIARIETNKRTGEKYYYVNEHIRGKWYAHNLMTMPEPLDDDLFTL